MLPSNNFANTRLSCFDGGKSLGSKFGVTLMLEGKADSQNRAMGGCMAISR